MQGQRKVLTLWLIQLHRCPLCHQAITKETGWNIHHIVERVKGGSDELSNLVLLHPNCHRQLHLI
ncbi:HNH endonuclease [Pseudoalteromonas luteoviolacea]|uniref:HNH endonuclease n=1 Tax=Pseudoalteromonas luteoviolacea TaxID=43657 RepID=UPI001FFCCCF6|nr:HNH endonuclease [Pseudoalteromonas luteoviolacea]